MAEPAGAPLLFLFSLAEQLGKSLEEVRRFSEVELAGWRAYNAAKRMLNER